MTPVLSVVQSTTFILGPQGRALEQSVAAAPQASSMPWGVGSGRGRPPPGASGGRRPKGAARSSTPFTLHRYRRGRISHVGGIRSSWTSGRTPSISISPKNRKKIKSESDHSVHLYGQPADTRLKLMEITGNTSLKVIEDCAWSFGAEYRDKRPGPSSDLATSASSVRPGGLRGGGMVITDDAKWPNSCTPPKPQKQSALLPRRDRIQHRAGGRSEAAVRSTRQVQADR